MSRRGQTALIYVLLVAATCAVYGQVRNFELVDFDDLSYIVDNPHVTGGLSVQNVTWAFSHAYEGYWSPLTWLSYMADTSMFGVRPGAYHLTNVVIHVASVCLLFAVLARMTRHPWPSAFVAAVFAVHPLHVESVAWAAERKDVLSGFFWFLTIWMYVLYVERPTWTRYASVIASFGCGLMAKPMVVTLPFVLLLLDVWPLARVSGTARQDDDSAGGRRRARVRPPVTGSGWRLVLEKTPLFALSALVSVVTIVVQHNAGAVAALNVVPIGTRLANAIVSPAVYLLKMAWPTGLAAIYPYPRSAPIGQAAMSAVVLAVISILALRARRRAPYLAVGWLWYIITLLPVLGLVQAGPQARADRYTYLSMVGITIMAGWGVADTTRRRPAIAPVVAMLACVLVSAYLALAYRQVPYWRDGETLFRRALAVTSGNYVAHAGLGSVLRSQRRFDEALEAYEKAIEAGPNYPEAYEQLGETLLATDRPDLAVTALTEAVRLKPEDAAARLNLGSALSRLDRTDEAAAAYREAIRIAPDSPGAHAGLGAALGRQGRLDEAGREFDEALRLDPGNAFPRYALGMVLAQHGRMADALPHFREAARLDPTSAEAHIQLGNTLAILGRMDEAIEELKAGARLRPGDADVRSNLGIALATQGRFDEAISEIAEAIRLKPDSPELRNNLAYVERRRREAGKH